MRRNSARQLANDEQRNTREFGWGHRPGQEASSNPVLILNDRWQRERMLWLNRDPIQGTNIWYSKCETRILVDLLGVITHEIDKSVEA